MTPRSRVKMQFAAVILVAGGLIATSGCDPRSLAYFLQPFESTIPPPKGAPSLEEKKVVILCNVTSAAARGISVAGARSAPELAEILRKKVKKITVVDPDKVATWVEAHPHWTDPADAARDFDADIADLSRSRAVSVPDARRPEHGSRRRQGAHPGLRDAISQEQQGQPIKDQPKEAHNIYDDYAESSFPNRGPLPIDSGTSRAAFKHTFLKIVVKEVSWHFVEHREEDSIQDSRIEK